MGSSWHVLLAACLLLIGPTGWGADPPASRGGELDALKKLDLDQLMEVEIPIVYGASKFEQKVTEAPADVSIVTQGEIKKFGHRVLADVLRSVREFYVTYDRNYGYIGTQGFNRPGDFGGRILLMVDGHRLNEPIYDSAFNLTDFILDVDLIDRVEVIRGPGSSLYGNNAFLAVVNVITRRGRDLDGAEAAAAIASYDTYQGRFSYGKRFTNGLELLVSGSGISSEGQDRLYFQAYDNPATHNGVAEGIDGDRAYSFLAKLSWRDWTFQGAYVSREKTVPTAAFGTLFNDSSFVTVDTRGYANVAYLHEFEADWVVKASSYYDYYRYDADYPYAGPNPGDPNLSNVDKAVAQWVGGEVVASKLLFEHHQVAVGGEWRWDFQTDQLNYDVNPPSTVLDSKNGANSFGIYAQDEYSICTNFIFNAGIRYDYFSTFGNSVNPRAALIYAPWTPTTFKLIYGQAFRAPNANELYYSSPFQKVNPLLEPEEIKSLRLTYLQQLPGNHELTLSGFVNRIDNLISQTTDLSDGLIYYENLESAETRGMSVEMDGRYSEGWQVKVSYTLQYSENTKTGDELSNSPRNLVKLNFIAPLYKDKLFTGLELQYSSDVKTLTGARADAYYIVNWTLFSREILKGIEVSASVYNLFNQDYGYPGAAELAPIDVIPQDGRSFRVKLTYKF